MMKLRISWQQRSTATTTRSNGPIADPAEPGSCTFNLLYLEKGKVLDAAVFELLRQSLWFQNVQNLKHENFRGCCF